VNEKLEHIVIKYLNLFYGDLEKIVAPENPDVEYFCKDDKVFLVKTLGVDFLYVNYIVWQELKDSFSLENEQIKEIMSKWVFESYNLYFEPKNIVH
jgi:hypothetical protein